MEKASGIVEMIDLIASLMPVFAVVLAFYFGLSQGKSQTRHENSAATIIELRRRMLELRTEFFRMASSNSSLHEWASQVVNRINKLHVYHLETRPWLDPETNAKVAPIVEAFYEQALKHVEATRNDRRTQTQEELGGWDELGIDHMLDDLEDEARRLIGTHRRERHKWRRWFDG